MASKYTYIYITAKYLETVLRYSDDTILSHCPCACQRMTKEAEYNDWQDCMRTSFFTPSKKRNFLTETHNLEEVKLSPWLFLVVKVHTTMNHLAVTFLLSSLLLLKATADANTRIVGGEVVSRSTEYPSFASFRARRQEGGKMKTTFCGGTLISPDILLVRVWILWDCHWSSFYLALPCCNPSTTQCANLDCSNAAPKENTLTPSYTLTPSSHHTDCCTLHSTI